MNAKTELARTPVPWLCSEVFASQHILTDKGGFIASLSSPANAAFTVTACNAHDELVAALRELVSLDDADEPYWWKDGPCAAMQAASNALAKIGAA